MSHHCMRQQRDISPLSRRWWATPPRSLFPVFRRCPVQDVLLQVADSGLSVRCTVANDWADPAVAEPLSRLNWSRALSFRRMRNCRRHVLLSCHKSTAFFPIAKHFHFKTGILFFVTENLLPAQCSLVALRFMPKCKLNWAILPTNFAQFTHQFRPICFATNHRYALKVYVIPNSRMNLCNIMIYLLYVCFLIVIVKYK